MILGILTLHSLTMWAQDIIYLKNGSEIKAKVIEIAEFTTIYKVFDQIQGPIRHIENDDIFMIIYQDGTRDVFKTKQSEKTNPESIHPATNHFQQTQNRTNDREMPNLSERCLRGESDADMYHGKKGSHVALGVIFGGFAIIGAALAEPTPENGISTKILTENRDLLQDPTYRSCYTKKARRNNVSNAATGWAAWLLFLILL